MNNFSLYDVNNAIHAIRYKLVSFSDSQSKHIQLKFEVLESSPDEGRLFSVLLIKAEMDTNTTETSNDNDDTVIRTVIAEIYEKSEARKPRIFVTDSSCITS